MIHTAPIPLLSREFYTREELAEMLRVSLRTVDEWVARQEISPFKRGRNVRFSREAVAEFIVRSTVLAKGQAMCMGQAQASLLRQLLEPVVRSIMDSRPSEPIKQGAI